jgi:monoamine oxidase
MVFTRRDLLSEIGAVAGVGATFAAMQALGLAAASPANAANFAMPPAPGKGRSLVILGAGIAGLVAAYEARRAGYSVTVIEARDRIGGRSWTIRGGDRVIQMDRPDQQATFSPGLYMNAGPTRLPSTHHVILSYARRLGVPLEIFVNSNDAAKWDFGGKVRTQREMKYGMRGRIGELLAKTINLKALGEAATDDELAAFRQFLGAYAWLQGDGSLGPLAPSGYSIWPGAYETVGTPLPALTLKQLLPNEGVVIPYFFESIIDMQATMLQPVGGMDRIAMALYEQVKPSVRLNAPISAIRREGNGVRIEHRGGATRANYCICALPAHLLERIPNDFSAAKKAALKDIAYLKSGKVGFEAPRFWETDDDIYGGIGWTDRQNENVLYPSGGLHAERGVLIGAYSAAWTRHDTPDAFVAKPIAEQIAISAASVEAMHPGKSRLLARPIAVNWGQVPYSEGVGPDGPEWRAGRRGARYDELIRPEGPIAFAGEHLAYVGLWQESAAVSAHAALELIAAMASN